MPFIRGAMLEKFVSVKFRGKAREHLEAREHLARFYVRWIVQAISHLHNSLIIHRDLQMSNLMIDEQGNIKLIDFAMAEKL